MIYSNYDTHLRATIRLTVLNRNELEKYASIDANID